ncbi:hypothetical protein BDQ94DRAFT_172353 [Aspergillus welwitschiae]|uniref:Xylanolytic transcriptional activator regulatory domain-containing protein n=1 Tax=Aspergillus welwitschiae TaxID=1341132 RepID=A0A3F3PY46_9EURO|nr:hypothetical protein BDQ94DRAFT_172353 [Aspergillus welwitschiae]RDH31256.1 hypothetical protein BDQ94DRAFT_172353 [Aspergillus welwitschiae]
MILSGGARPKDPTSAGFVGRLMPAQIISSGMYDLTLQINHLSVKDATKDLAEWFLERAAIAQPPNSSVMIPSPVVGVAGGTLPVSGHNDQNLQVRLNSKPEAEDGDILAEGLNLDLGLSKADLEFLDSLNNKYTDTQTEVQPTAARRASQPKNLEAPGPAPNVGYDNPPLADWAPRAEDNAHMDEGYLSVPKDLDYSMYTSGSNFRVLPEALSRENRDAAFAVVVLICQERNLSQIMRCFPSTELLDSVIQDFFLHQRSEVLSWIHEPTVELSKEYPEFILSLAAAGAVLSPMIALQRLGYALLEIARLQLYRRYESDNILTRHLRQQQAYALVLDIGLWSGDKRRIEIAESFEQPIVTMLRRSSRFKACTTVELPETEDPETLNQCWQNWVELESYKRLIYHLFVHDARASLYLSTNPIISYMELEIPFPCSRKLWEARSATEWKTLYEQEISLSNIKLPSLAKVLSNLPTLGELHGRADFPFAALVSLHGLSNIVADCNRSWSGPCGSWNALLFQSWQRELQIALEHFETIVRAANQSHIPIVSLVHQAVSLTLYMPLRNLEVFAGKDGAESSANIRRNFIDRIEPQQLRRASWHAGQLLRLSKLMAPSSLLGFRAVCLYFAALALWTYGAIVEKGPKARMKTPGPSDVFFLDGEHDPPALNRAAGESSLPYAFATVKRFV